MGINLALHAFLARELAPRDYGILVVGINTLMFISTLAMGGLNQSILKFVAGSASNAAPDRLRSLLSKLASVWLAMTLLITLGGWLLFSKYVGTKLGLTPRMVLLVFACGGALSLEQILAVFLRSFHAMPSASLLDGRTGGGVTKTFFLGTCFVCSIFGMSLSGAWALTFLLTSLLFVAPLGLWLLRNAWQKYCDDFAKDPQEAASNGEGVGFGNILQLSGSLLVTQVLVFLITRSDVWLAGSYVSKDDTALYTGVRWLILQTIAPLQILNVAISSSIAQLYAEGRKSELQAMLQSSTSLCSLITLPVLAIMALFSEQILGLLYGPFYAAGSSILIVLAIGQAINCVTGNSAQTLVLSGKVMAIFVVNFIAAALQIVLGWWAIKNHGIYGLAVATTIVTIVQCVAIWLLARVLTGVWTHPTLTPWKAFKSMK